MRPLLLLLPLASLACRGNPGIPRYAESAPPPLPHVAHPRPAESVPVAMKALPWWTLSGTGTHGDFLLQLGSDKKPVPKGRRIGPVRTRDVEVSRRVVEAARCAWAMVSFGEPRGCGDLERGEAIALARPAVAEARAELRAQAADAGGGAVVDVRCFARPAYWRPRARFPEPAVLWCEGIALADPADGPPGAPDVVPGYEPGAALEHDPQIADTRLVLAGDGSVGMLGTKAVVASTLSIRYRPLELGFTVVDLDRTSLAPRNDGLVGIGATVLGRFRLGRSRADALVGVTALAAAPNGSVNPDFDGLYQGFLGIAYQTPWKLAGAAQPFVQLRVGGAYGTVIANKGLPLLELHLGLSSPERR